MIACLILFHSISFAQEQGTQYRFDVVGWTFTLPPELKVVDSATQKHIMDKGRKYIEEAIDVKIPIDELTTLITARKNMFDYFGATIVPYDTKIDGDYHQANQFTKDALFRTFAQSMKNAKIDSVTTSGSIDNLSFDKFLITITLPENRMLNMVMLSKFYRGFDFGITYMYMDDEMKGKIENMLMTSTFERKDK